MPHAMIVEDHVALAEMLEAILRRSAGLESCTLISSFAVARDRIPSLAPHLIILDHRLADGNGLDLFSAFHEQLPETRWLLYSGCAPCYSLQGAISAGLDGAIDKRAPVAVLIEGVTAVLAGRRFFCEFTSRELRDGAAENKLNPTERRIISYVAVGLEAKEVAVALGCSYKTVLNSLVSIRRKTHTDSMVRIADYARKHGLATLAAPTVDAST